MKLHTDHHFVIGQTHLSAGKPCQDHAISGVSGVSSAAYAVLSDGCSSGGNTDIGARLITVSTVKALRLMGEPFQVFDQTADQITDVSRVLARSAANNLGLSQDDLLATQLVAVVDNEGKAFTHVQGDGAVAIVRQDGSALVSLYTWDLNMPWYPHYERGQFIQAHGGWDSPALCQTDFSFAPDGKLENMREISFTAKNGVNGITSYLDVTNRNKISLIVLLSDGISLIDKMPVTEVMRSLLGFKSLSGEFVKRRLNRFIKDCRTTGVGPLDDLSVAAIAIEHEPDQD